MFDLLKKMIAEDHYIDWINKRVNVITNYYGSNWFKNKKILELGAMFGDIGNYFYKLGSNMTLVEARSQNISLIKKNYPYLKIIRHDLDEKNWIFDNDYDLIINTGILYHLKYYENNLINCFKNCKNMFLETEVSDSDDDDFVLFIREDNVNDLSFNGIGCRPSEKNIEKIINQNDFTFERWFKKDLNSSIHIYDWISSNTEKYETGQRRAWFCKKNS